MNSSHENLQTDGNAGAHSTVANGTIQTFYAKLPKLFLKMYIFFEGKWNKLAWKEKRSICSCSLVSRKFAFAFAKNFSDININTWSFLWSFYYGSKHLQFFMAIKSIVCTNMLLFHVIAATWHTPLGNWTDQPIDSSVNRFS